MATVFYPLAENYQTHLIYTAYAFELNCQDDFDTFFIVASNNIDKVAYRNFFIEKTQTTKQVIVINDSDAFEKLGFIGEKYKRITSVSQKWLYQRILKLHADLLCGDNILCISDPDCITMKPFNFFKNGKLIVNYIENFSKPNNKFNDTVASIFFNDNLFTQYYFQTELMPTTSTFLANVRDFIGDFSKIDYSTFIDLEKYHFVAGSGWPKSPYTIFDLPEYVIKEIDLYNWDILTKNEIRAEFFAEWTIHAGYLCRNNYNEIHLNPITAKTNRIIVDVNDNDFDIYKDWNGHDEEAFFIVFQKRYQNFSI